MDFRRFAEDVFMREEQQRLETQQQDDSYSQLRGNVSGRGLEFQQALENTVMGGRRSSRIPPELQQLPQTEKVRRLAKEIHSLFKEFDSGTYFNNQCYLLCPSLLNSCVTFPPLNLFVSRSNACRCISGASASTRFGGNP